MAGKNKKDYRQKMADVAQWVEKLEFPGLTVAEIYSNVFGPCDVMRPTIEKFMLEEEHAEKVVQFLQVNLSVLNKDVQERMAEEKKKEAERAMLAQRQASISTNKEKDAEEKEGKNKGEHEEADGKQTEKEEVKEISWEEKFAIPIVDDYKKVTPRPTFVFIKNKEVIDVLTTANPPLMILMIKNSMSGRKTTGELSGLQQRIKEKREKKAAEEKRKVEEEKLAIIRNVPVDILKKQNSQTSNYIIQAFKGNEKFNELAILTTQEIKDRDQEDAAKLDYGIKLAVDKGVIPANLKEQDTFAVDVIGKTAEQVADIIVEKLGDAPKKGCVMTLEGLSGTGKGTTVATLKEKLPNATTWSNGDIFRSITLLAVKFAEESKVDLDESLKPENLAKFMAMLKFDKFDGEFDIEINGLGFKERVSKVNKTLLKSKEIATHIPKVAAVTQGEVIMFVKGALTKMVEAGLNVLVEGRAATLKYIETPHRFELTMSNPHLIGARRAAQRIGSTALEKAEEAKDGKTWPILEKTMLAMLPENLGKEGIVKEEDKKEEGKRGEAKPEEAKKEGNEENNKKKEIMEPTKEEGEKAEEEKEEESNKSEGEKKE